MPDKFDDSISPAEQKMIEKYVGQMTEVAKTEDITVIRFVMSQMAGELIAKTINFGRLVNEVKGARDEFAEGDANVAARDRLDIILKLLDEEYR